MKKEEPKDEGLSLPQWVTRGTMRYNRDALALDDPDSWPMQWNKKYKSMDGFPWKNLYSGQAEEAREEFMRKDIKQFTHCPHCGEQLF